MFAMDPGFFNTVVATYDARAGETLMSYTADEYLSDPLQSRVIPDWNRVESALSDFLPALLEAAGLDQEEERSAHSGLHRPD